ncbi:MAG: cell division protein FtsZ [Pseudomonadota bacterium]
MFEIVETDDEQPVIKVIGLGGGGGNAVNHMVTAQIAGVDFICANTDAQDLRKSIAKIKLQLGASITKGLGAGANPEVGRAAALEDRDRIEEALKGADMVFITAGMGGGTGTGAAAVVAELARELGILTVAVVTKPFPHEGPKRMRIAEKGIEELAKYVDSLITIPNEKLLSSLGPNTRLLDAFKAANDVLLNATRGIAELITHPGLINVDFADVRTVMRDMGVAMMGTGTASGDNRARIAAEAAINNPLLEDIDLSGAKGILVSITSGPDLSLQEFNEVGDTVRELADEDATIVVGTVINDDMEAQEIRVTVVATGLGHCRKTKESAKPEEPIMRLVKNASEPDIRATGTHAAHALPKALPKKDTEQPSLRPRRSQATPLMKDPGGHGQPDIDLNYLDIPAFLRRQAD